jgi:hypothetical protein
MKTKSYLRASVLLIFEVFARCKDLQATPVFSFWLPQFARHGDFPERKLPGRRDLRDFRASVASATSVCSVLFLTLFFSVSPWLCGEILLVAAVSPRVYLGPNFFHV